MRLIAFASVLLLVSTTPAVAGHDHPMTDDPESATPASVSPVITGSLAATLAQALADSAGVASEKHPASTEKAYSPKSPSKALSLSLVSTGVPLITGLGLAATDGSGEVAAILILGGVVVGPSVGHFYAGNTGHGLLTSSFRSIGIVTGLVGLAVGYEERAAIAFFVGGAALTIGLIAYDIASAPGAAREYNERKRLSRFSIGPTYIVAESTPGIAVQYRF